MSLFSGPEEHAANPPSTWKVVKGGNRLWHVQTANGDTIESTETKRGGEEQTRTGFYVKLYEDEGRWYAGERVRGWRPWVEVKAENERKARWAKKEG